MTTVNSLLKSLMNVPEDKGDLPCIAIDSASGVSYELGTSGRIQVAGEPHNAGVLCDMHGEEFVRFYLD